MAELKTRFETQRPHGLLGPANDELRLRIHGPRRDGQLVVVRVPKCTIGSADSCSFPLHGPGIHTVHCIILRGQRGAVVRCVAPGTTLNGMQIQDAAIFAGDRLRIGPYELEVLPTVANVKDLNPPSSAQPAPTSHARVPTSDAKHSAAMDPPSLGDLASMIETRIKRIEGQLTALQQESGQANYYEPKSEEIKLAQEAIASLSRQLDCERERNGVSFTSLVAERDRLASELAGATQTATDLVRELEQVRSEQVENHAEFELYSQRIDEVSDENVQRIAEFSEVHAQQIAEIFEVHAQRIAEVSDDHAQRISEVSAEVDRLAKRIAETDQHHQLASDRWQASNDDLEQRLTDGVSQLTQLEQQLDLVRHNHEDAEVQRQLQGSQSEEIQESVRALKEQLSDQQSQQDALQANWATEHQQLHDKFQQLEELHQQAVTQQATSPTQSSPQAPTAAVAPEFTEACEPRSEDTLSVADLNDDVDPQPDISHGPLQLDDEGPGEQPQETPLSRLDQLRASRVVAEMQTQSETTHAFSGGESQITEQSGTSHEFGSDPSVERDAVLGITNQATNLEGQTGGEDHTIDASTQPTVSERDRMFDLLNGPKDGLSTDTTVASQPFGAEPTSPDSGGDLPSGDTSADDVSDHAGGAFDAPNPNSVPADTVEEEAESPISGTPISAADLLAQMAQPDIVEQDTSVAREAIDNEPQENLDEQPKSRTVGHSDDSIEAYMNQLLARVRGGDDSTEEPLKAAVPTTESNWKKTCEAADDPANKTDGSVLSELVARSEAPEQSEDMSAMRELANDTTRSAIATYDQRSDGKFVLGKLIAAGIGVSAAVLSTMYLEDAPIVRLFGIGFGLTSAAVWTWQAIVLKQRSDVTADPAISPDDNADVETSATFEEESASSDDNEPASSVDGNALTL